MLCRTLRGLLAGRLALSGLVCLALLGGAAVPAHVGLADGERATIGLRAPEAPLAALSTTSSLRFEKHAASARLSQHKPERSSHAARFMRGQPVPRRSDVSPASPVLARRFLPSRHLVPCASDDGGDPLPTRLSLS